MAEPQAIVVVDLDGTLIPGNSFRAFLRWVVPWSARRGRLGTAGAVLGAAGLRAIRLISRPTMKRAVLRATQRVPVAAFADRLAATVRPELVARIAEHRRAGLPVVLATAAPDHYLDAVTRRAGLDGVVATSSAVGPGWQELVGPRKLEALQRRYGDDVVLHTVYSDHTDDLALLHRAHHAVVVAPTASQWARLQAAGLSCELMGEVR